MTARLVSSTKTVPGTECGGLIVSKMVLLVIASTITTIMTIVFSIETIWFMIYGSPVQSVTVTRVSDSFFWAQEDKAI